MVDVLSYQDEEPQIKKMSPEQHWNNAISKILLSKGLYITHLSVYVIFLSSRSLGITPITLPPSFNTVSATPPIIPTLAPP